MSRLKPSAHRRVRLAVAAGELVRQPCEVCGEAKTDAHHDDYTKPLEVRWLCRRHHQRLHHPETTPPIMVRADISREELKALRRIALDENTSTQQLLADLVRARIANS